MPSAKGKWFRDRQLVTHLMGFLIEGEVLEVSLRSSSTDFTGSYILVTRGIGVTLGHPLETPILEITWVEG